MTGPPRERSAAAVSALRCGLWAARYFETRCLSSRGPRERSTGTPERATQAHPATSTPTPTHTAAPLLRTPPGAKRLPRRTQQLPPIIRPSAPLSTVARRAAEATRATRRLAGTPPRPTLTASSGRVSHRAPRGTYPTPPNPVCTRVGDAPTPQPTRQPHPSTTHLMRLSPAMGACAGASGCTRVRRVRAGGCAPRARTRRPAAAAARRSAGPCGPAATAPTPERPSGAGGAPVMMAGCGGDSREQGAG